ncbi:MULTISPECIES: hypothetical protein [Methylomonas]|uniref:Nickel/cobalt transporter regulator n=2 Tax=Methylomonas TaxID=416 RepID=A0A140E570_9GAMM|nr:MULTISPECIES: hypothetical protein [Methylomonas]AMK75544.1 hypothetical protein JT25_003425 [Methylomonas denitrificans]OAI09163.1 hypothetical protein A1342_08180 [Methylomonas methanica]TCV79040.1 hypothetical protein EDE11_12217 [Methylomonas methanica]
MCKLLLMPRHGLSLLLASTLFIAPAYADKPGRGHGSEYKHSQHQKHEREDHPNYDDRSYNREKFDSRREPYFNDQHRLSISQYYTDQYRSGHCPPGLQKKHNGCLPPGQAKKWRLGYPLPRDVVYYDIPSTIIGPAPAGYRFVRVASDILMIAIGSGMVIDALTDLNGM